MLLTPVLDPLWRPVGDPHANGGKACFQSALGPKPPTHIFPLGVSKHVFRRHRQQIRDVRLTGGPPTSYRKRSPMAFHSGDVVLSAVITARSSAVYRGGPPTRPRRPYADPLLPRLDSAFRSCLRRSGESRQHRCRSAAP